MKMRLHFFHNRNRIPNHRLCIFEVTDRLHHKRHNIASINFELKFLKVFKIVTLNMARYNLCISHYVKFYIKNVSSQTIKIQLKRYKNKNKTNFS